MDQSEPAVIIDNGSGSIKAGLSGEDTPKVVQPTLIGVPRMPGIMVGMDQKDYYVGKEAVEKANFLNMSEPIQEGYIQDWDDMLKIWNQIFQDLNVSPKENPIFIADTPLTPRSDREKMAEILFEEIETPYLCMYNQAVLSLFSFGRTTGLVLDSGEGRTHAVPVYEGFALPYGVLKVNISGKDITQFLERKLKEKGFHYSNSNLRRTVLEIKDGYCNVAYDFDTLLKNSAENRNQKEHYKMPDGSSLEIGDERFVCPEALFQPGLIGKDSTGVADTVFKAISNCDSNIAKDLYSSIVLSGGTCMVKGLRDRLQKDVKALAPSTMQIEVFAPPERAYSAWLGGSILTMLSSFKHMFIRKTDYHESGAIEVYKKCF